MNVTEIQHLFVYTEWANDLVLGAAEHLSQDQLVKDVGISHKSILGTLAHMAGAEWIWLERWHGNSITGTDAWTAWSPEQFGSVQQVRGKWQPIIEKRHSYL